MGWTLAGLVRYKHAIVRQWRDVLQNFQSETKQPRPSHPSRHRYCLMRDQGGKKVRRENVLVLRYTVSLDSGLRARTSNQRFTKCSCTSLRHVLVEQEHSRRFLITSLSLPIGKPCSCVEDLHLLGAYATLLFPRSGIDDQVFFIRHYF